MRRNETEAAGTIDDLRLRLDKLLDLSAERMAGLPDDRLDLGSAWSGFLRLDRVPARTLGVPYPRAHDPGREDLCAPRPGAERPALLVRHVLATGARRRIYGRQGVDAAVERVARAAAEAPRPSTRRASGRGLKIVSRPTEATMPRLDRICTKTGDEGMTGLGGGQRVAKDARRVVTYGTVDELNSQIGVALATGLCERLTTELAPSRTSSSTWARTCAGRRTTRGERASRRSRRATWSTSSGSSTSSTASSAT